LKEPQVAKPRLFFYLGLGLIISSFLSLAIRTEVNVQNPDFSDYELLNIGFLFAPVIGSYGLASLMLGVTEVSMSKKKALSCFFPFFGIICVFASFSVWLAVGLGSIAPFWWIYVGLFFIPAIIVLAVGLAQFTKKKRLNELLKHQIMRKLFFGILLAVPLLFTVILWLLFQT
jgi:hypothetical protein